MKWKLKYLNKRFKLTKETINKLEDRSIDIIQFEEQNGKMGKESEQNLRKYWDTIKCTNINIMEVPKERREGKG